jgi:plastocyanin
MRPRLMLVLVLPVLLILPADSVIASRAGGTIVGVVSTKVTAERPIRVTIDPAVCGATLPDESVTVDAAGHLANAVLTVTGLKAAAPAEVALSNATCQFVPHVATIRPGGSIKVASKDPLLHTTHATMEGGKSLFNVGLPIPNIVVSRSVDKPGVATLSCNTHTWMRGYLVVTEELAAVSAATGAFKLENIPAGTHEIRFWHEKLKAAPVKVTIKDGETVTVNFEAIK